MQRTIVVPAELPGAALDQLKQWLAIRSSTDDIALGGLLRTALEMCEAFTGTMPIACTCEEILSASGEWQALATRPVQSIAGVEAIPAEGARTPLSPDAYAIELEADGAGLIEAHAKVDMLLHPAVEGEITAPPADPVEGECWLIGPAASENFAGKDGWLASYQSGTWLFAPPRDGMRVFERATGQLLLYAGEWRRQPAPSAPAEGTIVDQEARQTLAGLIAALRHMGIFPGD